MTVTGLVFSITMLTLAQTSAQFGSRLLRTVLQSNVTQFTLGVFLSTSVFCFVVLRNIRELQDAESRQAFVPHLSTAVAMLLGLASLAVFIYFVHHVSRAIQAQSIVKAVSDEFQSAIHRLFPEKVGEEDDPVEFQSALSESAPLAIIKANRVGYLQAMNVEALVQFACHYDVVILFTVSPGDFIVSGGQIGSIQAGDVAALPQNYSAKINDCLIVGEQRTPRQDIGCPINELVEVAVRALSPGINDPLTAISCIEYMTNGFADLVQRKPSAPFRSDNKGDLRLMLKTVETSQLIDSGFHQIRHYASNTPVVLLRMLECLAVIAQFTNDEKILNTLRKHGEIIKRTCGDQITEQLDCQEMIERIESLNHTIEAR